MPHNIVHQKGFVHIVIVIVILVLILSYFNFDIQGFIEKPIVQKNLQTVWSWTLWVWNNILRTPTLYVWQLIIPYIFREAHVQISG